MGITEKELLDLIEIKTDVEKISSISSDGRNLLTRIPKEIREKLDLGKGRKLRWIVSKDNEIKIEIVGKNEGE